MTTLSPKLRKAAVLISALDETAAEALLDQMGSEQAAKVRSALVALDDISASEQQHVLEEFLQQQGAPKALAAAEHDGVALEIDPALEAVADDAPHFQTPSAGHLPAKPKSFLHDSASTERSASPWAFLDGVAPQRFARTLRQEHPQVVAAVVGQLPAEQAGAVLENFPAEFATNVLERMAELQELSPDVTADLARELEQKLLPHGRGTAQASPGHLTAVLAAMDFRQRQRVILQLANRNTELLGRLGLSTPSPGFASRATEEVKAFRYRLEGNRQASLAHSTSTAARGGRASAGSSVAIIDFDEFVQLSDRALREVFAVADPEIVLLALTAADERLTERILRQLPVAERSILRERLEHPGPLRLREIERAQHELAVIAGHLAQAGTIELPPAIRFAAAV